MATYNPETLQRYADALYVRAYVFLAGFALGGFLLGNVIDYANGLHALSVLKFEHAPFFCAFGGAAIGWARSFMLRVEAQRLLCLMQIEKNTRGNYEPTEEK